MRLTAEEVGAIKAAARHAFGDGVVVRLFGSRVDDERKGGDIDLHVEVESVEDETRAIARFEDNLFARIEEQRVDVVVRTRRAPMRGIDVIAHRDGVSL